MKSNNPITVGDETVEPGQRISVNLPIADLYMGTSLGMPVNVICGRKPGPVLFVSAAIHGNELNGVEIIRRLLKRKGLGAIHGTLLAVPVVNVHGFLNQSRYLPDRRDLNRSFPGSRTGSIAARLANTFLTEIVSKADYGVDLHTGAINRSNLPQIRANLDDEKTLELARVFGVPVVVNSDSLDGSLRACAVDRGIPMLIYEAGEALRFDEISIRGGVRGVLNVMHSIGMLPSIKGNKRGNPVEARSTRWVRAPSSGIVTAEVNLGTSVAKGDCLATIRSPLSELQDRLHAPFDGIVIGRNNLPLAHEGEALFNLAAFKSVSRAELLVEEFTAEHDPELFND
ncbi:MAG: succinylglutamate desuccinylase/aspartoacylase family protein [Gammaproteobacteria bacterium]|nr:succinylglutamate desuccinylase/aspartoacylase family protein [Gammaproteobacteria bacterium]